MFPASAYLLSRQSLRTCPITCSLLRPVGRWLTVQILPHLGVFQPKAGQPEELPLVLRYSLTFGKMHLALCIFLKSELSAHHYFK